jgi:arsenate reductase (glutaredoxin)
MLPASTDRPLLLHNPRCSKSREAKALLDARGVAYEERRYLETPLTREELGDLARRLARPAREWTRTQEPAWAALGLPASAPNESLLDAIARHPELLERPMLVRGERAVVGRPPDAILELLA